MLLSSTKNEPVHYMLKIESFSILSDQDRNIKIESDVFEAAGHKWRLELYPKGHDEEMEEEHISLFLVICDVEGLSKGWGVRVDVNFLVYDHIRQNYVSFQDDDGRRTKFHEKQMDWGFDELISLEHFREASRGYLFNDSCVFGVEVFAVPDFSLNDRCLSIIKPPSTMNTFTWTIDNFSRVKEHCLTSEVFKVGNVKWTLLLYPNGRILRMYIKIHEAKLFPDGWRVYALFELRVKNQCGDEDDKVIETDHWFCKSSVTWWFSDFMPLSELNDRTKGFLMNDRLIVETKISVVGLLKKFI